MKYIPQAREDQKQLLDAIGFKNTEELFTHIPAQLRAKKLNYPPAQSEMELRETFKQISQLSTLPKLNFAGCGIYAHDIPSIVPFLQGRSEFATSYTPYQPEISQGTLQAIFEFQTLACQLTETELSNASMYDGATALAEGVLMGIRLKKKSSGKILLSGALHPFYEQTIRTYCEEFKDRIEKIDIEKDHIDLVKLEKILQSGADILVTQSPNIFGVIEDYSQIGEWIQKSETLWVTSTMEPISFGILRGPGAFGAHIVTAEGQSFGNAAYLGGSSFGIFTTRNEYLRQLPGRLVGETVDTKGRRSYTLTFATREQFIRREKATSNICTNNNLNMLAGLIHMATLGKQGLKELASQNLSLCEYLKNKIRTETKLSISNSPTFNEFVVETTKPASAIVEQAANEGWVCGVDLGRFNPAWKNKLLIHVSELHKPQDLDKVASFLKQNL
ncbi:MAG: aminomethyl-transferring glycine dehydrogenase subunit GcvPA [Deltaproteobacteria bacterium]|nr:aminomethyl-transferring glycine dehydrogenase subunit GcvPA [Deltaproteobacteria bacterium]